MMRTSLLLLTVATLALAACNPFNRSKTPEGLPFAASLTEQKNGGLTVTVRANGAGLDAARESARYPVTQHCLLKTGSSVADWVKDSSGDWAQARDERGNLILNARCRG